ncbi:universal stress protein [Desulfosporosinus meridiei]|uniref:Universal stress protein UspA-like protein n=1 Tax=Desulfosporosinus meridiei (strain ATCC BAA-275 / DSM 13257 / KCTC 12902 / NCIMB 13706 / S10) TaxID=768704 RepID=J7IVH0_DESMD|nr:universal stress protein [Desulfosporosinus meridiei]AFQ42711.1 universal stress protein UspA-like protein [Desulfosporosinus meridiei DSM 13257]
MNQGNLFKVLLYFDGTPHSLSAAVYTADLLKRIPHMSLNIVHAQESVEGVFIPGEYNLMGQWSSDLCSVKQEVNKASQDSKIIAKINEIFFKTGQDVSQEVIFANSNIPDIVDSIIDYSTKQRPELIIMGTRGPSSFKGLMHGSLAHSVLNKSKIPVLLIKKLPQEFIDEFCSSSSEKSGRRKGRRNHLYEVKTI